MARKRAKASTQASTQVEYLSPNLKEALETAKLLQSAPVSKQLLEIALLPKGDREARLNTLFEKGTEQVFSHIDSNGVSQYDISERNAGGPVYEYLRAASGSVERFNIFGGFTELTVDPERNFLKNNFGIEKNKHCDLDDPGLRNKVLNAIETDNFQRLARAVAVEPIIRELGQAEKYYEARKNTASSSTSDSGILTARKEWCQNAKAQFESHVLTGESISIDSPSNKERVNESSSFWGLVKKVTSAIASFCGKKMGIDAHYHSALTFANTLPASTSAPAPAA